MFVFKCGLFIVLYMICTDQTVCRITVWMGYRLNWWIKWNVFLWYIQDVYIGLYFHRSIKTIWFSCINLLPKAFDLYMFVGCDPCRTIKWTHRPMYNAFVLLLILFHLDLLIHSLYFTQHVSHSCFICECMYFVAFDETALFYVSSPQN